MLPRTWCDLDVVARNARAWQAYAGVPIRAVVKADGYRFGAADIVRTLDDICPGFCVADVDELIAVRAVTDKPIVILGSIEPTLIPKALDAGALVTISNGDELTIAAGWAAARGRPLRLRIGLRAAAGWTGIELDALGALAPRLAAHGAEVEMWTHLPDLGAIDAQVERLHEGVATLRRNGVRVISLDAASTLPLAQRGALGDYVRIGVGLFGATGNADIQGVRNAIRVEAAVIGSEGLEAGARIGYGDGRLAQAAKVASVRCGYSDGYPASAAGSGDVLFVGMQYTSIRTGAAPAATVYLVDESSSLDRLAAAANRSVHEIVTALGAGRSREPEA